MLAVCAEAWCWQPDGGDLLHAAVHWLHPLRHCRSLRADSRCRAVIVCLDDGALSVRNRLSSVRCRLAIAPVASSLHEAHSLQGHQSMLGRMGTAWHKGLSCLCCTIEQRGSATQHLCGIAPTSLTSMFRAQTVRTKERRMSSCAFSWVSACCRSAVFVADSCALRSSMVMLASAQTASRVCATAAGSVPLACRLAASELNMS